MVRNIISLVAFASIFAGLWWMHPPSALVVCGTLVLAGMVYSHMSGGFRA